MEMLNDIEAEASGSLTAAEPLSAAPDIETDDGVNREHDNDAGGNWR